jgi:hypothetical protein
MITFSNVEISEWVMKWIMELSVAVILGSHDKCRCRLRGKYRMMQKTHVIPSKKKISTVKTNFL